MESPVYAIFSLSAFQDIDRKSYSAVLLNDARNLYRPRSILDNKSFPGLNKSFETFGYHDVQATIARELKTFRIYPQNVEDFPKWDTSFVWDKFPQHIHVLTIHGIQDDRIPVYVSIITNRRSKFAERVGIYSKVRCRVVFEGAR